jgi:hypothetical protein
MSILYPALVFMGAALAWDLSGQAELAHFNFSVPPAGDGFIPWTPPLPLHSSCDEKETKSFLTKSTPIN